MLTDTERKVQRVLPHLGGWVLPKVGATLPIVGATGDCYPWISNWCYCPADQRLVVADVHRVLWGGRCSHTLPLASKNLPHLLLCINGYCL